MSTNLSLGLTAAIIWFGVYFWYFRGTARIKADFANIAVRLRLRRRDAGK